MIGRQGEGDDGPGHDSAFHDSGSDLRRAQAHERHLRGKDHPGHRLRAAVAAAHGVQAVNGHGTNGAFRPAHGVNAGGAVALRGCGADEKRAEKQALPARGV